MSFRLGLGSSYSYETIAIYFEVRMASSCQTKIQDWLCEYKHDSQFDGIETYAYQGERSY